MARVLYEMVNSEPTRRVASIGNSQLGATWLVGYYQSQRQSQSG